MRGFQTRAGVEKTLDVKMTAALDTKIRATAPPRAERDGRIGRWGRACGETPAVARLSQHHADADFSPANR
jgi:hypothetical protein